MRNKFADIIYKTGTKNKKIFVLVADISPAGSMSKFREKYPNRFINTGVAEQSMIGIAAGMALRGFRPFCYTIATFALYRPFEMIRVDLCYQNLPVTIVGMGTGTVYSTLGGTHLTQEDVSIARSIPNMNIIAPCDPNEMQDAVKYCCNKSKNPIYLRIGKAPRGLIRKTKEEKRQKVPERTDSPGPGAYNPKVRLTKGGKSGASYTREKKYYRKKKKRAPGPG